MVYMVYLTLSEVLYLISCCTEPYSCVPNSRACLNKWTIGKNAKNLIVEHLFYTISIATNNRTPGTFFHCVDSHTSLIIRDTRVSQRHQIAVDARAEYIMEYICVGELNFVIYYAITSSAWLTYLEKIGGVWMGQSLGDTQKLDI